MIEAPPRLFALGLLAGALLQAGCPIDDGCEPGPDSERLLLAYPADDPPPDPDSPHVYVGLQNALDAVKGSEVRTTVCAASGVYYETIVVPPNVHLLGRGLERVRIRPPRVVTETPPDLIPRVLVTVGTNENHPATRVEGIDAAGGAACFAVGGGGAVELVGVRAANCAVGVLASGTGTLDLLQASIRDNSLWGVHARDLQRLTLASGSDLVGNGRDRLTPRDAWEGAERASAVAAVQGVGAVRAFGVRELELRDLEISGNEEDGGLLRISGGRLLLRDVRAEHRRRAEGPATAADGTGGDGAVVAADAGADLWLDRVWARTEGQPLVSLTGGSMRIDNTTWYGARAPRSEAWLGDPTLALRGATARVRHSTFQGPDEGVLLDLQDGASAELWHVLAWGHATAFTTDALDPAVDGGYVLLQDDSFFAGTGLIPSADPLFRPGAEDGSLLSASPARCAGSDAAPWFLAEDRLGAARPASAGKAPDLGALESAESCR